MLMKTMNFQNFSNLTKFLRCRSIKFLFDIAKDRLYVSLNHNLRRSCQHVMSRVVENLVVLISPVLCHMAEETAKYSISY